MTTKKKKCKCGTSNLSCKKCSRIKMVILLAANYHHVKYVDSHGNRVNPVWYSPFYQNAKPDATIINGMIRRFQKNPLFNVTNVLQFYNNETNTLIHECR